MSTLHYGIEARTRVLAGVDLVADAVSTSIGPAGCALLASRRHAAPAMIRSGYEIARELTETGVQTRSGAVLMQNLAHTVLDAAGDGTSTTILLARALLRGVLRAASAGLPSDMLESAASAHLDVIKAELNILPFPRDDAEALASLATRAAGGDRDIGEALARATREIGDDGTILIEKSSGIEDGIEFAKGLHVETPPLSPHLADDDQSGIARLQRPLVLLHHGGIGSLSAIVPALEMIVRAGRSLLLIADEIDDEALGTLVINKRRAGLAVAAIKSPGTGLWRLPMLEDIAVATGGAVLSPVMGTGLSSLSPSMMGEAKSATVTRRRTMIDGPAGAQSALRERLATIRSQIENERWLSLDRDLHRQRLARLNGSIARLAIGGRTHTEQSLRHAAARRAAAVVASARAGGLASGGGSAFVGAATRAGLGLSREPLDRAVAAIFRTALSAPTSSIACNAGVDGREVARKLEMEQGMAFDVTSRSFVPASALTEPAMVLTTSLTAALSCALQLARAEVHLTRHG